LFFGFTADLAHRWTAYESLDMLTFQESSCVQISFCNPMVSCDQDLLCLSVGSWLMRLDSHLV